MAIKHIAASGRAKYNPVNEPANQRTGWVANSTHRYGNLVMTSPRSHIELGCWQVTQASVRDYLSAVGDSHAAYDELGLAPPLALAAHALGVMLEKLALPPGTIHSLQEVETLRPIPYGSSVVGSVTVEPPRLRGRLQFITASFTLSDRVGQELMVGKTTVLVTGEGT